MHVARRSESASPAPPAPPAPRRRPAGVLGRDDLRGRTVLGCDVVIVGTGAGGATFGAELAEAGFDVVMLEEGGYHATEEFTPDASAMIRKLYRDGGASMAVGSPPILFQEGRTVGGSTVINGGMSWRTPERILDRWAREDGLEGVRAADMEPFFDRVEKRIHVAYQDPETIGRDHQLLKLGAEKMRWDMIPNLRNQLHCAGTNNCAFGCPTAAKRSALVTYVPRALHFGARVYSDVRVTKVLRHGKRAIGVQGRVVEADGRLGAPITVRARLVVCAAGAMQTPALLARSGVRSPSGQLGQRLSLHPNGKVVAIFDDQVRGWEGVHQAYQVREFQEEGILLTAVNVPPSILAMSMPHYGAEMDEILRDYNRAVVAGCLVEDSGTGHIKVAPGGRPFAFYQLSDFDAERIQRALALLCELLFAAGARRIHVPFAGVPVLRSADDVRRIYRDPLRKSAMEIFTVHLMGTARMGADRARAVTDGWGGVYDADRLLVCDASLFPSPIGINPCQTIQALATRSAAHVIDDSRRYLS